jgi:uncharacterized membrane protein
MIIILFELLVLSLTVGSIVLIIIGVILLKRAKGRKNEAKQGKMLISVGAGLLVIYALLRVLGLL